MVGRPQPVLGQPGINGLYFGGEARVGSRLLQTLLMFLLSVGELIAALIVWPAHQSRAVCRLGEDQAPGFVTQAFARAVQFCLAHDCFHFVFVNAPLMRTVGLRYLSAGHVLRKFVLVSDKNFESSEVQVSISKTPCQTLYSSLRSPYKTLGQFFP